MLNICFLIYPFVAWIMSMPMKSRLIFLQGAIKSSWRVICKQTSNLVPQRAQKPVSKVKPFPPEQPRSIKLWIRRLIHVPQRARKPVSKLKPFPPEQRRSIKLWIMRILLDGREDGQSLRRPPHQSSCVNVLKLFSFLPI